MKTIYFSTLISFFFTTAVFCQNEIIPLTNPSFEDYPRAERVPNGWVDCGFPGESLADTHPSGAFEVSKLPSSGNTYLGMVVRDTDTWERVGQKLTSPLIGGQCYAFKIDSCKSELYVSMSMKTGMRANYVQPASLVVWGGNSMCDRAERLVTTRLIGNTNWETYNLTFQPSENFEYLILEAYYKKPVVAYNGNVLVDNASSIVPVPCDCLMKWSEFIQPEPSYYNSSLSSVEKELVIEDILNQITSYPEEKVIIIIKEETKEVRDAEINEFAKRFFKLGISADSYELYTY